MNLREVIGECVRLLTTNVYVIDKWCHITLSVGKNSKEEGSEHC